MVDEKPEVIKQEMEETRSSLVEKIETLEQQVAQTVHQATSAVSSTVETVKDVVGSTTEAVQSVVDSTTEAVQSTVETVKGTFDLSAHIDRHPWAAFGAAVAAGFAAGKLIPPPRTTRSHTGQDWSSWAQSQSRAQPQPEPQPQPERQSQSSSMLSGLSSLLEKPLDMAKGLAVGALFSVIRDVVSQSLPDEWSKQLAATVEDLNKQFGGLALEPIKHDNGHSSERGDGQHGERYQSKVAGQMGATDWQGQESLGPTHRR